MAKISITLIALLVAAELWTARRQGRRVYSTRETIANFVLGASYLMVGGFTGVWLYKYYSWLYEHRLFDLPKAVWVFGALVLLDDFINYWVHRLLHENRVYWAVHEVHHSSEEYNISTATRLSIPTLLTIWPFWTIVPLLGFPPEWILIQGAISHVYGIFTHTRVIGKLGFLENYLSTPSNHRVHHGRDVKYLDRNYGVIFIFWDRMFGSYQAEQEEPNYGVMTPIASTNPVWITLRPWVGIAKDVYKAPGLRAKLGYLWHSPGWKHDGTGLTASQLQAAEGIAPPPGLRLEHLGLARRGRESARPSGLRNPSKAPASAESQTSA